MVQLALRRFGDAGPDHPRSAPAQHVYCNATRMIERMAERRDEENYLLQWDPALYRDDPRWPLECDECHRPFDDTWPDRPLSDQVGDLNDRWQVWQEPIYTDGKGGEWQMRELPAGAMYDASWMPDRWRGPDGISLAVVLPGESRGPWLADGPSSSGGSWSRTGDPRNPPTLTCSPSIFANAPQPWPKGYHGFLQAGVLTNPL